MSEDEAARERQTSVALVDMMITSARRLLEIAQGLNVLYEKQEAISGMTWLSEEERNRILVLKLEINQDIKELGRLKTDPGQDNFGKITDVISKQLAEIATELDEYVSRPLEYVDWTDDRIRLNPVLPFLFGGITAGILFLVIGYQADSVPPYVAAFLTLVCSLLFWAATQLAAERAGWRSERASREKILRAGPALVSGPSGSNSNAS